MRTRPWPLVLLALLQILSPVGTVLFNAWALGVHPSYVLDWVFQARALRVFESVLLMPIAGVAIYSMKRWSYFVFLVAMAWSFGANVLNWGYAKSSFTGSLGLVIALYLLQIGLAAYFMLPSVRRTYLDQSVRWWESKRRFAFELPAKLHIGQAARNGILRNLSEAGALVCSHESFDPGVRGELEFELAGSRHSVSFEFVRTAPTRGNVPENGIEYGIRFAHTPETERDFSRLARGLELIGVPSRDAELKTPLESLRDWFVTLLKTGKGLTPELSPSRRSAERRPGPPGSRA